MPNLEQKSLEIGFSFDEVKGIFTGYASVYNEVDRINDTILPGAYDNEIKRWSNKEKSIPINFEHEKEIKLAENLNLMVSDEKGLLVEWTFSEEAKKLYPEIWKWAVTLAKRGELYMSIGFKVIESELGNTRYTLKNKFLSMDVLKEIILDHIAITDYPVDGKAEIIEVKSKQNSEEDTLNLNVELKNISGKVAAKKFLKEHKSIISNTNVENFVNHVFDLARSKKEMIEIEKKSQCDKEVSVQRDKTDDFDSILDEVAFKLK